MILIRGDYDLIFHIFISNIQHVSLSKFYRMFLVYVCMVSVILCHLKLFKVQYLRK